jgi:hypothetical protein
MPLFRKSGKEEPDYKFDAEYMGGHKIYPKKRDTEVLVYQDRISLKKLDLDITFESMKNIENSDVERLTKTRMILTPFFIGFLWKKRYLYTVIDYNDGLDDQSIILDLHRSVEKAQSIIYQRILSNRKTQGQPAMHEQIPPETGPKSKQREGGSPF